MSSLFAGQGDHCVTLPIGRIVATRKEGKITVKTAGCREILPAPLENRPIRPVFHFNTGACRPSVVELTGRLAAENPVDVRCPANDERQHDERADEHDLE